MAIVTRENLFVIDEGEREKAETMIGLALDSAHKTLVYLNEHIVEANSQEHFALQMSTAILMIAYRAERNLGLDIDVCLKLAQLAHDEDFVRLNPGKVN